MAQKPSVLRHGVGWQVMSQENKIPDFSIIYLSLVIISLCTTHQFDPCLHLKAFGLLCKRNICLTFLPECGSFQFFNSDGKHPGKGGNRYYKNNGLEFKAPGERNEYFIEYIMDIIYSEGIFSKRAK